MSTKNMVSILPVKGIHALGGACVLGMLGGAAGFIFVHTQDVSQELESTKVAYSSTLAELDTQNQTGAKLQSRAGVLDARLESLPTLKSASSYNQRSADLASSAEEAGIRIDGLQPEDRMSEGKVSWIPIVCDGQGTIDSLMIWIEVLEKSWPDIVVQSVNVELASQGELLQLRVLFRWYVLGEQSG